MDEEKEFNNVQTRQTVRPSMVVMTSKLLNVSEGIAAMNVRIAIGVFLCLLLIVATFIVNVIAFDYAKDNKVQGGSLVDKDSGLQVQTTGTHPFQPLEFSLLQFAKLQVFGAEVSNGRAWYQALAKEMRDCAESDAGHACCQEKDTAYLIFTGNPAITICAVNDNGVMDFLEAEPEFVARTSVAPKKDHYRRDLLCSDFCECFPDIPGCGGCC